MLVRWVIRCQSACQVSIFWERLRVITQPIANTSFGIISSVSLLRMNLTERTFVPRKNSHICRIVLSPNYALVRSKTSNTSLKSKSNTFQYFSGTRIIFSLFFDGRSVFSTNTPSTTGDSSHIPTSRVLVMGEEWLFITGLKLCYILTEYTFYSNGGTDFTCFDSVLAQLSSLSNKLSSQVVDGLSLVFDSAAGVVDSLASVTLIQLAMEMSTQSLISMTISLIMFQTLLGISSQSYYIFYSMAQP